MTLRIDQIIDPLDVVVVTGAGTLLYGAYEVARLAFYVVKGVVDGVMKANSAHQQIVLELQKHRQKIDAQFV